MKNSFRILLIALLCIVYANLSRAEQVHLKPATKSTTTIKSTAAGCLPGASFKYLEINNVRTRINTGGDMWMDFEVAQYEIPKGSKKMSMFSASLWIGGVDVNDQLKLAAVRYRQGPAVITGSSNDYWPGPLTIDGTAAVSQQTCSEYDKLFPITRAEVDEYLANCNAAGEPAPGYVIPENITNWPGNPKNGDGISNFLAPFYDRSGDDNYDPQDGDYPYYDISNALCHTNSPTAEGNGILVDQVIKGDATLWWVFNDKGNIHTETSGSPIGLEIRGQAFAFSTNDEINNMTFYSYEIINRSTFKLRDTYFSQWVDPDLGFANDDYVGCDVKRGLGYCYNGTQKDGNGQSWAYGEQPPAVGVDFFQGPYMDKDGLDNPKYNPKTGANCDVSINGVNFGNGIKDDERYGMRRFVYHNNSNSGVPDYMTDPVYAPEYYNFLRGIWKDGTKMEYGGNGHRSAGAYGPACDFMFPDLSDPCNWGTGGLPPNGIVKWTEQSAGNKPEDRRFMQSAGPFTLEPGAVNYITVGIPWALAASGGPFASVQLLKVVDDKCQDLFDNCFKVIEGPRAPDLTLQELDKELIVYISNRKWPDAGNNFNEAYKEIDPSIKSPDSLGSDKRYDSTYRFEGYMVYQLLNSQVSISDIHDPKRAVLVFQCDIKNNVTQLVNHYFDQALESNVPVEEVNGSNKGIVHSFKLQNDKFTEERLINHKQYYFLAVAYGYNEFMKYSTEPGSQSPPTSGLAGQKKPFLSGRKGIKVITGIPHIPVGTTSISSEYGDGPIITRIQGQGNGGRLIDLSDESIAEILTKQPVDSLNVLGSPNYPISYHPTYKKGRGPIDVKVIDPLNVKEASYMLRFDSLYNKNLVIGNDTVIASIQTAKWSLIDNSTGKEYRSDTTITINNEQLFPELGISVSIQQVFYPGPYKTSMIVNGSPPPANLPVYRPLLDNNGLIESSVEYADSSKRWYLGVPDIDGGTVFDWIRAGQFSNPADTKDNDWDVAKGKPFDPDGNYEKVIFGTVAPYILTAYSTQNEAGPALNNTTGNTSKVLSRMADLASVDIVFTPDKLKWTRCPVVEMCADTSLSEGHVEKFTIRAGKSVNVDGATDITSSDPMMNSSYISSTGMGWFPGYAINIETGERLNIIFGENSWLVGENGRDMKFNPTSNLLDISGNVIFGGQHYFYVMAHTQAKKEKTPDLRFDCPAYDAGANLRANLTRSSNIALKFRMDYQYSNAMYVGMPLANPEVPFLSTEMKMRIRIQKPYQRYYSTPPDSAYGLSDTENRNFPLYSFETKGIATVTNNIEKAKSDLDLINVVPNPYYAGKSYEVNQLDNRVKITNLPQKCTVTIYSSNGTIIRQYNKDESKTTIDWDLKNYAGIPIAGGIYLIHIKSEGIGERVIKFFGALRPVDLNSF